MIIYLFDEENIHSVSISTRLTGMYPIDFNDKVIANIYCENNKWFIKYSDDFETTVSCEELLLYKVYVLTAKYSHKRYVIVTLPKYDTKEKRYFINGAITIGNNLNCDIFYPLNNVGDNVLQAVPIENGRWQLKLTESSIMFVGNKKIFNDMIVYNGDCIFYFGLRVILLGKMIIVNSVNGAIKIKPGIFRECLQEEDYRPQANNSDVNNDAPLFAVNDYFFKAPRFNFIVEEKTIKLDAPPEKQEKDDIPAILTIGPQITMMSASGFSLINVVMNYASGQGELSQFLISIGSVGIMMVGSALWPTLTRVFSNKRIKKKEKKRQEKYSLYLEKKKREIQLVKEDQKNILENNHMDINKCLNVIDNRSRELWQRNIDHNDFLDIRVGFGKDKAKIKINEPEEKFSMEDDDNLFNKMKSVIEFAKYNENIPITYNFTDSSLNAIVGSRKLVKEFMDCIFLQMMTFHSYVDLKLVIFTKDSYQWDYLKMAPHCWDNSKSIRYYATSVEELISISTDLEKVFDARVADDDEEKKEDDGDDSSQSKSNFKDYKPYYLFFIDDITAVRNVSLLKKILKYKRNMGFSLIMTSDSISGLPSETSNFICVTENDSAIVTSKINDNQKLFKADFNKNNQIDMSLCVQKLANIPVMVEKAKYELPKSLTFLEMYNVGRVEQLNCLNRWEDNDPISSLSVPVGIDQNGEMFKMDIHEKAYGPHGLVAGTTGSGKSEWIVTYILSLAVNFNPDEVQFVLIDYKGGGLAKSFENEEMNIKLPHLAGTITNLDKSEIFRSIAAIESELKRRQAMFNDAREKLKEGSMNIYKYQQFYRKGLLDEPLSHLLIICDEFAELKQQQPEFMEQLISTSRIGRSLGIHLILATQKPSGVVNEQIWSNSKFKVCLKVQDKSDSNEILKKPDAAFLKQTGAFYLQVGNDDYYNLGQSAWAGAKYYPSDIVKKQIDDSIQYIDNIGHTKGSFQEEDNKKPQESQGEELLNIVSYISDLTKHITLKAQQLWLPNIPAKIYLGNIMKKYNKVSKGRYNYEIAIGEYDEPRKQMQGLLTINLAGGNVAIMGQGGSGVESLISTMIFSSLCEHTPKDIAFYILDFGSETMKKFAKFPQVGEVVFQEDIDKVVAVLDLVISEIDRRKELLSDYNGSFEYYNKTQEDKLPLIVTVINSFDIFCESLPKLSDLMNNLFRDAPKYGVIFIVSVSTSSGLRVRQLQFFNHVIITQFNDDTQYRTITNCRRGLIPKKTLGRGICKTDDTNADSYCEFQTAFIAEEEKELDYIKKYAELCNKTYKTKVKQLAKIPEDVKANDLVSYVTDITSVPIGIDFYEKTPAKYDFSKYKIHMLSTKNLKANINSIYGISTMLSKIPGVKVRIIDFIGIFKKIIFDTKQFSDDLDLVFGAIENDVLNRKETQDWAVNIVVGIGSYKKTLSKAGIEIFKNTFNSIAKSKKSIFILVDDYDKLRTMKLEEWYSQVDESHGIWLGGDVNGQSLITVNEVNPENEKLNFEGMGYEVIDNEGIFIKTILEGED